VAAGQPSPNPTAHLAGEWEGTLVPEHALRTPNAPARQRVSRLRRPSFTRSTSSNTATIGRNSAGHSPKRLSFRRSRLVVATCAIAGAATLGACSPANVSTGNHAVNIAYQYLGTPYVYGGSSPGGFDCSGLTGYVYAKLGKFLPRSAEAQYEATQHIPQSWAQKGDLIFFGSPGAVYHVGIYVGNGIIEHAPHQGTTVEFARIWDGSYMVGRVA
jgi:cell wall-associated NlpC family hydrolase